MYRHLDVPYRGSLRGYVPDMATERIGLAIFLALATGVLSGCALSGSLFMDRLSLLGSLVSLGLAIAVFLGAWLPGHRREKQRLAMLALEDKAAPTEEATPKPEEPLSYEQGLLQAMADGTEEAWVEEHYLPSLGSSQPLPPGLQHLSAKGFTRQPHELPQAENRLLLPLPEPRPEATEPDYLQLLGLGQSSEDVEFRFRQAPPS